MKQSTIGRKYGLKLDIPDFRDRKFNLTISPNDLPDIVDLRSGMPSVYNQGSLGSCTANAIGAAYDYDHNKQGSGFLTPSRLFIYFNERDMEGTIDSDAGACIRDGIKSINTLGVCPESIWPYDIDKFTHKPSRAAYESALQDVSIEYSTVDNTSLNQVRTALASGFPIIFGMSVYDSFESQHVAQTGNVDLPGANESLVGGHAVLCVGFDMNTRRVLVRNSWGDSWGQAGYFTLPFTFFTSDRLISDCWVIKQVK